MIEICLVEKALEESGELMPFVPCWGKFTTTFAGLDKYNSKFNVKKQAQYFILSQLDKTGHVTEEQFFYFLINLDVLAIEVICKESFTLWNPIKESFTSFENKHPHINISFQSNPIKLKTYYDWIMTLCDWQISSVHAANKKTLH